METQNIWDALIYIKKRREVTDQIRVVLHTDGVLYPISESDTKDYWIYGTGRTKLNKIKVQYVPKYNGKIEKFTDYLATYGSKVTYFCLTGKSWCPQELSEGRGMEEFMQLEAFGLQYLEYVKDWKRLDKLVAGLLESYGLKDFWFNHYYDKISLKPSYTLFFFIQVSVHMDVLNHDLKLVNTYRTVEYLKRKKDYPINKPISVQTDEEFEQNRLIDRYNGNLAEEIDNECLEATNLRFPVCMNERVRWFYGDKGVELYERLMDIRNYTNEAHE